MGGKDNEIYSLSRDNITSTIMKKDLSQEISNSKLIEELFEIDKPSISNKYRSNVESLYYFYSFIKNDIRPEIFKLGNGALKKFTKSMIISSYLSV